MSGHVAQKLLALLGGTVLFGVALWHWHADSAIAAWMQAGFSVLAIIAAIWIAEVQANRERRLEVSRYRADQIQRLEAIQAICKHAEQILEQIAARRTDPTYIDKPKVRQIELSQLADVRTALMGIPLHDVSPWSVAEAVLSLLRTTGDVRETVMNSPQLTTSWTPQRGELFSVNAAAAKMAGASVRDALNSIRTDEPRHGAPDAPIPDPVPDMYQLVEAVHAPTDNAYGEPTTVHVQFSDETHRDIVSYFGGPQDPNFYPNIAAISSSDPRYHVWYYAQHEGFKQELPIPARNQ